MKLKSTLWALAFACAAVSCSDDLENGPNGNNGNGEMGEAAAYLKVVVNSDIATKAATLQEEAGSHSEYEVKDVTIILFDNGTTSTDYGFGAESQIKGVGFAQVGKMEGGNTANHSFMAQIEVPVSDPGSTLAGNTYGVIAVTNLGGSKETPNDLYRAIKDPTSDPKITKGSDLADYIIKYEQYNSTPNGFVMSTHAMQWPTGSGEKSEVTFDENPTDENHAPTVNVYVERLAAKIRIKEDPDNGENFFYSIPSPGNESETIAKVALRQAAIVNQLNSGSYLLKRVSETITGDGDPTEAGKQTYLGKEVWDMSNGKDEVTANYVIDPWFFKKNANADIADKLSYINPYRSENQEPMNNIGTIWDSYKGTVSLSSTEANDNEAIRLAYVMENTTKVGTSLQGYATGAVFKATYYPAQMSEVDATGSVTEQPVTYNGTEFKNIDNTTTGVTFYRYEGKIFKDYDAIFAYYLNEHGHFSDDSPKSECNYTDFIGDEFKKLNIQDFHDHFYTDEEAKHDPFDYLDYLHKKSKGQTVTTFGELTDVKDFTDYMKSKPDATTYTGVDEFKEGECYYTYWIKHQDNKNSHLTAPMEYSIVRNNIYELRISGISGLGFARSMVPDPKDPTEDSNQLLNVVLHVKDWVVRPNGGIIL